MKSWGPANYPETWENSALWSGKVSVHFGYAKYGWVQLSLITTAYCGVLTIHLSNTFDPFGDLVDWLKLVADNRLPAAFKIDEEGQWKELIVQPYQGRFSKYGDIEFRINGDYWDPKTEQYKLGCYFLTRAMRSQLLGEFSRRLDQWLKEDYDPDGWLPSWAKDGLDPGYPDLKKLDIAGLKKKIPPKPV